MMMSSRFRSLVPVMVVLFTLTQCNGGGAGGAAEGTSEESGLTAEGNEAAAIEEAVAIEETVVESGEGACTDADQDGACADKDCNDAESGVFPNAPETDGDSIDSNCDGQDNYVDPKTLDLDGDGFTFNTGDCDDGNKDINPTAKEGYFYGNGGKGHADKEDNDCDGRIDETVCSCALLKGHSSPDGATMEEELAYASEDATGDEPLLSDETDDEAMQLMAEDAEAAAEIEETVEAAVMPESDEVVSEDEGDAAPSTEEKIGINKDKLNKLQAKIKAKKGLGTKIKDATRQDGDIKGKIKDKGKSQGKRVDIAKKSKMGKIAVKPKFKLKDPGAKKTKLAKLVKKDPEKALKKLKRKVRRTRTELCTMNVDKFKELGHFDCIEQAAKNEDGTTNADDASVDPVETDTDEADETVEDGTESSAPVETGDDVAASAPTESADGGDSATDPAPAVDPSEPSATVPATDDAGESTTDPVAETAPVETTPAETAPAEESAPVADDASDAEDKSCSGEFCFTGFATVTNPCNAMTSHTYPILFLSANEGYIGCGGADGAASTGYAGAGLYQTSDGGVNWTKITDASSGIGGMSQMKVYDLVLGDDGAVYVSGLNNVPGSTYEYEYYGVKKSNSDFGYVYKIQSGKFSKVLTKAQTHPNSLTGQSIAVTGSKIVVDSDGGMEIYYSSDSGATWTRTELWEEGNLNGGSRSAMQVQDLKASGGKFYAVGSTNTDGPNFFKPSTATGAAFYNLKKVKMDSSTTALTYQLIPAATDTWLSGLWGRNNADQTKILYRSSDNGETWKAATVNTLDATYVVDWVSGIGCSDDGDTCLAVARKSKGGGVHVGGYILYSTDGGASWTEYANTDVVDLTEGDILCNVEFQANNFWLGCSDGSLHMGAVE